MRDAMTKLRILMDMLVGTLSDWRENIWKSDLDSRVCCNGRECCCDGVTIREIYGYGLDSEKPKA